MACLPHPVPQELSTQIRVQRVRQIAYPVALVRLLLLRVQNYIQHVRCVLLERGLLVELHHARLVIRVNIQLLRLLQAIRCV